jgi:hypothetical protein
MRVLVIGTDRTDTMAEVILHGLKMMPGMAVVDVPKVDHMYQPKGEWSLHGTLPDLPVDRTEIERKITDQYFDAIVYSSIYRTHEYWDLVTKAYPPNKVLCIDGEDNPRVGQVSVDAGFWNSYRLVHDYGAKYFKRELADESYLWGFLNCTSISMEFNAPDVFPIGFGFPKEKFYHPPVAKTKAFADNIPGQQGTHHFIVEGLFYQDYQTSLFGLTQKKAGTWCLRHLEILSQKCVPYWLGKPDLDELSLKMLFRFPRELAQQALLLPGVEVVQESVTIQPEKHIVTARLTSDFNPRLYDQLLDEIYDYTWNNLTTKHVAEYLLSFLE